MLLLQPRFLHHQRNDVSASLRSLRNTNSDDIAWSLRQLTPQALQSSILHLLRPLLRVLLLPPLRMLSRPSWPGAVRPIARTGPATFMT